jgi:hypothetical protein
MALLSVKPIITAVNSVVYQKKGCLIELQCLAEANPYPSDEGLAWIKDATTYSLSTNRYKHHLAFFHVFSIKCHVLDMRCDP